MSTVEVTACLYARWWVGCGNWTREKRNLIIMMNLINHGIDRSVEEITSIYLYGTTWRVASIASDAQAGDWCLLREIKM